MRGRFGFLLAASFALTSVHLAPAEMPEATAVAQDPEAAVHRYFEARTTGLTQGDLRRLVPIIVAEAERAGLEPALVLAVIEVESGGRHRARSRADARGLMQLLPTTGATLAVDAGIPWDGPETLYDPVSNVRLGVRYLAYLVDRFDDVPTALAAYNAGPTRVARLLRRGHPIPRRYAQRVIRAWGSEDRFEI